jgi:hypothetical protein
MWHDKQPQHPNKSNPDPNPDPNSDSDSDSDSNSRYDAAERQIALSG